MWLPKDPSFNSLRSSSSGFLVLCEGRQNSSALRSLCCFPWRSRRHQWSFVFPLGSPLSTPASRLQICQSSCCKNQRGDCSVGKVLTLQAGGPGTYVFFKKKSEHIGPHTPPALERQKQMDPLVLLASQSSKISEFQDKERPYFQKRGGWLLRFQEFSIISNDPVYRTPKLIIYFRRKTWLKLYGSSPLFLLSSGVAFQTFAMNFQ